MDAQVDHFDSNNAQNLVDTEVARYIIVFNVRIVGVIIFQYKNHHRIAKKWEMMGA